MLHHTLCEYWIFPFYIRNEYSLIFYQTLPRLQHVNVVCRSPKYNHLSFPNGSTLFSTNTSIYTSLFFIKIGHFHSVNIWASQIPVLQTISGLQRYILPPTWSFLALKMEAAYSFKIFVSSNTNIICHFPKPCL
jgi:hypothetical protein